jgi:hypothetical protein
MFYTANGSKYVGKETKRAAFAIFTKDAFYPKRGEKAVVGALIKDWNKAMRQVLTPPELSEAAVFLVVNQSAMRYLVCAELKAQLLSYVKVPIPNGTEERSAGVAYTYFPYDRLISPQHMQSGEAQFVWYGTSGPYNLAELLLTLAVGYKLGLPVHFDNYCAIQQEASTGQLGMRKFVDALEVSVGVQFDLTLLTTQASVFRGVNGTARAFAYELEHVNDHNVLLLHDPQYGDVRVGDDRWLSAYGSKTLQQLHKEGVKMGGAFIYAAFYKQASSATGQKFVAVLHDTSKGNVHRTAVSYMRAPHGLWVCPVGSFKICPRGEAETLVMQEPLEFLAKIRKWGREQETLLKLWELALSRVPLTPEAIGSKVVVEVGDNAIYVKTSQ